jgi:hypothetical protein
MLAPSTFPKWLPRAVALEAQRILSADTADAAIALRLATDERMKPVWQRLPPNSDVLIIFFLVRLPVSISQAGSRKCLRPRSSNRAIST